MNQPNPCTFWDEERVVEYLEKSGDPNAYVSFAWQCQHDLYQMKTVCPPLAVLACLTSAVGFVLMPCFWFEETHLLVAGPLSEAQFAKGNSTTISKERAQSTLAGVKLLIRHGADANLPATRGPCMNGSGRAPISNYPMMRDAELDGITVDADKVKVKVRQPVTMRPNVHRQASVSTLKTSASAPPIMNRNLEADRWERRIKQYRSMNAMDGVTIPESDAVKLFSDLPFKDIYDQIANEKKLILPEIWTEEYTNNIDIGRMPDDVRRNLMPTLPADLVRALSENNKNNKEEPQTSSKTENDDLLDLL